MKCVARLLVPVFLFVLPSVAGAGQAENTKLRFNVLSVQTIQERLQRVVIKNAEREEVLKAIFQEAGCTEAELTEQGVKHEPLPNLVCTLAGTTNSTVIVGAHFDHVRTGQGVVDNWSGASLLPSLFEGLRGEPRKHTFVFVGFTDEENGLIGSRFYAKELTYQQVAQTRAMINMDSVGMGPTKVWSTHSDPNLVAFLNGTAKAMGLSLQGVNADNVGDDDSESFIRRKVPTLMIHSVTQETLPILHSPQDVLGAIKLGDYYDSYRLLLEYLAFLDGALD